MKIEVKNDNKITFIGKSWGLYYWMKPIQREDMILEAKKKGILGGYFSPPVGNDETKRRIDRYIIAGVLFNNRFLDFEIPYYTGKQERTFWHQDSIWR